MVNNIVKEPPKLSGITYINVHKKSRLLHIFPWSVHSWSMHLLSGTHITSLERTQCKAARWAISNYNWGEPERAPHKRKVRAVDLSVCLSFCPYVHDTKIYKSNINLRSIFSCWLQHLRRVWCTALYANVQQTCSDKQHE